VGRVHLVAIRETGNDGHGSRKDVCCWCGGGEKMTSGTQVEDGPLSIMSASVVIVFRSNKAAMA
jgi:hypothetical protein